MILMGDFLLRMVTGVEPALYRRTIFVSFLFLLSYRHIRFCPMEIQLTILLFDNLQNSHPQMIRRETMIQSYDTVIEDLMKNHDVFLSTLRSRLTKLQVRL